MASIPCARRLLGCATLILAVFISSSALAVTFEEAALASGYTYESTGVIDVGYGIIDSLAGVTHFPGALEIWANDNLLSEVAENQFSGLVNLQMLWLSWNRISSIESGAFSGVTNLRKLLLSGNQISSIDVGDFTGLTNLRELTALRSGICAIQPGALSELENLNTLNLDFNQISAINAGTFSGLTNLKDFSLAYNQVTEIDVNAFAELPTLRWLWLDHNRISNIELGTFSSQPNLKGLYLASNGIAAIESGAFSGLPNLAVLNLAGNALTHLNLSRSDLQNLEQFYATPGNAISSVDMSRVSLSIYAFRMVMRDLEMGEITAIDFNAADLSSVRSLSPMYTLDDLVTLDLPFAKLPSVNELDDLVSALESYRLDNLTLSLDQWWAMDGATRTALSNWDAGPANTLTLVPEPSAWVLMVGAMTLMAVLRKRTKTRVNA